MDERCCCESNLIEAGTVIARYYRVNRCLSIGRAGAVYLCEVLEDEESPPPLVAVKMLFRGVCKEGERNPNFVRFYREVEAIFRIAHPNVVSAFQFISHEGQIGYSMDYVSGGTLAQQLGSRGAFSETEAIEMLDHLSRGLEAIHRAGVIHRDLKPDNILVTPQLQPKISDFGVAFCGHGQRLTAKGSVVGVLQYLSPEYLEKGLITRQGDVYALGAIGYELVVGVPPFWGLGLCETIEAKVSGIAPGAQERNAAVSKEFSGLLATALTSNPENRFRSAAEFNDALRALARQSRLAPSHDDVAGMPRELAHLSESTIPQELFEESGLIRANGRSSMSYSRALLIITFGLLVSFLFWL